MSEEKKIEPLLKKSVGRLIASQALCIYYNENNEDKDLLNILNSINKYYVTEHFTDEDGDNIYLKVYNSNFVLDLINSVIRNVEEYDDLINEFLDKQDTTGTIDEVLLPVFRLAIYELKSGKTDKNIIINEYTDIVAEFFDGIYITFANGILDNIATYLTTGEKKIHNNNKVKTEIIHKPKTKQNRKTIKLKIKKEEENGK